MQHPGVTERRANTGWDADLPFMLELRRAITNARQTSPGKDGICYKMLANMKDTSLTARLKMFSLIWETGKIPSAWKQSVIVPILKPGKVPSDPTSDGNTEANTSCREQKSDICASKWIW